MANEFKDIWDFQDRKEVVAHIENGGIVMIKWLAIDRDLLNELRKSWKEDKLCSNGMLIQNKKKEEIFSTLWISLAQNELKSYQERENYCKQIRYFIEELKNTDIISEEQNKKQHAYAIQIQQFFPKTIWLPDMIGTDYFSWRTEQQYAHIDNDIMNLAQELTAVYVNKKLNKQDDIIDTPISQA